MRCSPLAITITGSPSATKTIDLAIWASSQPTALAASWTVRVGRSSLRTSTRRPSSSAVLSTFSRTSLVWHGSARDRSCRRGQLHTSRVRELAQRRGQILRELFDVPQQVEVAHKAEVHAAVVAHDRHPEALPRRQRDHREGVEQLPAQQVERKL